MKILLLDECYKFKYDDTLNMYHIPVPYENISDMEERLSVYYNEELFRMENLSLIRTIRK